MRRWLAVTASLAVFGAPSVAAAGPNLTVGLAVAGGAGETAGGVRGAFSLGARASALFLRARDADMGVGPYAEVGTTRFDGVDLGAGAEWLVPVFEHVPVVLSAGPLARHDAAGWHPGGTAMLFAGTRSHNFHSVYGLAAGLFVQSRLLVDGVPRAEFVLGAQIDALLLALPFVLALNAAR